MNTVKSPSKTKTPTPEKGSIWRAGTQFHYVIGKDNKTEERTVTNLETGAVIRRGHEANLSNAELVHGLEFVCKEAEIIINPLQ